MFVPAPAVAHEEGVGGTAGPEVDATGAGAEVDENGAGPQWFAGVEEFVGGGAAEEFPAPQVEVPFAVPKPSQSSQ